MRLIIYCMLLVCLSACVNVQQYQEKGVSNLSNTELLEYRRSLITLIIRIDHDVSYNEIDARINSRMIGAYRSVGLNHAANQASQDLVGNIVVAFFNEKNLTDYYNQLYAVSYELKRRGWDGAFGFNNQPSTEYIESGNNNNEFKINQIKPKEPAKIRIGKSSLSVEKLAQGAGCAQTDKTELVSVENGIEFYKVDCKGHEPMMFRCEFLNCAKLQ